MFIGEDTNQVELAGLLNVLGSTPIVIRIN